MKKKNKNKKQEEIAINVISFLKKNGVKSKNDIATTIKTDNSTSDFEVVMDYLLDLRLIKDYGHLNYMITSDGRRFESFEKLEEEKSLPMRLAKSNIEANELNRVIAGRNEKNEIKNRRNNRINLVVAIILCLATVAQVILLIQQLK